MHEIKQLKDFYIPLVIFNGRAYPKIRKKVVV